MSEKTLSKLENEITTLQEELEVCKQAKMASESCDALFEFVEMIDEPFSVGAGPNDWHKSAGGGGGCTIL